MRCQVIVLISSFLLFNSCATLLHKPYVNVSVKSNLDSALVIVNGIDTFCCSDITIPIRRSKQDLHLTLKKDSITKEVLVKREFSKLFSIGNLFAGPMFIGYWIDSRTEKRFTYTKDVFIDLAQKDSLIILSSKINKAKVKFNALEFGRKGNWFLTYLIPYVNNFLLQPDDEFRKLNTGFWGSTLGVEYFYQQNKYVRLSASTAADLFIPVPAPVDISGEYEFMGTYNLAITNNHQNHRMLFGYGLAFAHNIWDLRYSDRFDPLPPTRDPVRKTNNAIGLNLNVHRLFGRKGQFPIGIVYRPTLFRLGSENSFQYEHLISLDFGWRIKLNRKSNKT